MEKSNSIIIEMANYILNNSTTIRATAKTFNIPKSTVHNNLSIKLKTLDRRLYNRVQTLLKNNFQIKHIHGGEATKKKFEKLKQNINILDQLEALK